MLFLPVLFHDACIDEQDVDAAMLFSLPPQAILPQSGAPASEEITSMPGAY
jgi:hypothetical protein